jgi:hypothetical protein
VTVEVTARQIFWGLIVLYSQANQNGQYCFECGLISDTSVAEPHHFYAGPAALSLALSLLYTKLTVLKQAKVNICA